MDINQTENQKILWYLTLMLKDCDLYIQYREKLLTDKNPDLILGLGVCRFWRTSIAMIPYTKKLERVEELAEKINTLENFSSESEFTQSKVIITQMKTILFTYFRQIYTLEKENIKQVNNTFKYFNTFNKTQELLISYFDIIVTDYDLKLD